ncbi:MAG: ECF transporter S component [Candidatus Hodarchaeales archaeon]|jgi:energy-coupling factor transport system substrate-specific component
MEPINGEKTSNEEVKAPYYFDTADLIIIALFAALGGVSSSFIGQIIRSIFQPLGLPGVGQSMAGIHILWYILTFLLTNRKIGTVTLTGIIKGCIELFSGSSLGIIAFFISVIGAILFEIVYFGFKLIEITPKLQTHVVSLAGGIASASNVIIQYETFLKMFSNNNFPPEWIIVISILSFASGIGFSYFGQLLHNEFEKAGILDWRKKPKN